jgi:triosephosphate isomerase
MSGHFDRLLIGSNLKMYKTNQQTLDYARQLQALTADIPRSELTLFILPAYVTLAAVCRQVDHSLLKVGAQNMHWEEQGQFTGEISPLMLQEIGVDLVMVGHAERRQLFGDQDWMVNKRALSALAHGFQVLICIGETAEDKAYRVSAERLRQQLTIALHGVHAVDLERVWVAYEPVWAIGAGGQQADPFYANTMHAVIHATLESLYPEHGTCIPVLYGGSVNLENAPALIAQPEIDGLFIGRAAWDAADFNRILHSVIEIHRGVTK